MTACPKYAKLGGPPLSNRASAQSKAGGKTRCPEEAWLLCAPDKRVITPGARKRKHTGEQSGDNKCARAP